MSLIGNSAEEHIERIAQLESDLATARRVLTLIADNGGKTTDEGVTCSGSWCGEQARRGLEKVDTTTPCAATTPPTRPS